MKRNLIKVVVVMTVALSNIAVSANEVDSSIVNNYNDGLEGCHQLDQYEVDDYDWYVSSSEYGDNLYSLYSVTLPQYTANTYFTNNSKECTDHGMVNGVYVGNPCSAGVACNCKEFELSIQCAGFARYVYTSYHGYSINSVSKKNLGIRITSSSEAKTLIKDLPDGTFIKVQARTDAGSLIDHFMIISQADEDNVLLYHANYGGNCRVRNMRISYELFADKFPYVYYTG